MPGRVYSSDEKFNIIMESFQTLSRRSRLLDLHVINMEIESLYSINEIAAFDSYMIHACKQSTAERRRKYRNYKDPDSSWGYSTMGYEYGSKIMHP